MANGSFGLSGFPTAPTTTSTGGGTNNALTPVTVAVNSVAGFSSGNLVYNRSGDYSTPVSSTGTATFPITATVPIYSPSAPSWTSTTTTGNGDSAIINATGIATAYSYAATLTNGNIVIVYQNAGTGNTSFKILDESYNVVVAETATSGALATSTATIGVIALTGGGFVIYSRDATPNLVFAIYSNAGAVVTAATTDATYIFTTYLQAVARPDGSWIVYGVTSTSLFVYKVYSAVGVQVYAWTTIGTALNTSSQVSISVRSDNSFVLAWYITGTSLLTYAVRSATNTVTVAPTSTGVTGAANRPISSVCLSTNDVVFVYQSATGGAYFARTLSSANVLASAVTLLAYDGTYIGDPSRMDVYLLASDNYLVACMNNLGGSSLSYRCTVYFVANSSGTILSGTTPIVLNSTMGSNTGSVNWNVFVRTTNYIHNINGPMFDLAYSAAASNLNCSIVATRVNPTTYKIVPIQSISQVVGNTAAQPVSAYAPGGSNVTTAAYSPTTSGTITTAFAPTSTAQTGTVVESFTANTMDACPLSGGGTAILYYQTSTGTVKVAVYNSAMVLQTTLSFTTGFTSTLTASYKVIQLSNGKLVVIYQTSSSALSFKVYSTSYALLTTVSPSGSYTFGSLTDQLCIAPLSGGRFVLSMLMGNQPYYAVYNDTGTNLTGNVNVHGVTSTCNSVASTANGFVCSHFYSAGSNNMVVGYYESSDGSNSFTTGGTYNRGGGPANFKDLKSVTTVGGVAVSTFCNSSTTVQATISAATRATLNSNTALNLNGIVVTSDFTNGTAWAFFGAPSCGGQVTGAINITTKTVSLYYTAGSAAAGGATASFTIDSTALTTTGGFRLTPLYGSIMVLSYINTSQYPAYVLVNVANSSYDTTLVAGSTVSNATQTLAPSTGYYLLGVAASDCAANGSGNVTINGSATLNSTYPATATAQSFDFSSPVTFGAKGTQLNRNVNLQGNV